MTCLIAFSTAGWGATPVSLNYSAASPSAAQIDGYLSQKNSTMAGTGAGLSSLAQQYNVDPRLVVAISGAETTFGAHTCAANNAWNWFHRYTCPQSFFQSYQEGAEHVTKYLRLSYLNRGYDSIELIRYKYCATGCDNWIPLVTRFYDEIPPGTLAPSGGSDANSSPVNQPGRTSNAIGGVPAYLIFFSCAAFVGFWSIRGFRK